MSNIIRFDGFTKADMRPDDVLEAAKGELELCFVIGFDKNNEWYFAGSTSDCAKAVYVAQKFVKFMLEDTDD